jgi:hypothetical protein
MLCFKNVAAALLTAFTEVTEVWSGLLAASSVVAGMVAQESATLNPDNWQQ